MFINYICLHNKKLYYQIIKDNKTDEIIGYKQLINKDNYNISIIDNFLYQIKDNNIICKLSYNDYLIIE